MVFGVRVCFWCHAVFQKKKLPIFPHIPGIFSKEAADIAVSALCLCILPSSQQRSSLACFGHSSVSLWVWSKPCNMPNVEGRRCRGKFRTGEVNQYLRRVHESLPLPHVACLWGFELKFARFKGVQGNSWLPLKLGHVASTREAVV